MLKNREEYRKLVSKFKDISIPERNAIIKHLAKTDLYFLCWFVLGWDFYDCTFGFDFCKKVAKDPNRLWLVARGHLKSLTITTAQNIQDILNNPELSIAIMSYNLKTAKSFLRQIKYILETNNLLISLFPEILYKKPDKESPKWSEQEGIVVKRTGNRKEPTFYAFGLVDSQATGFHFDIHSFDDAVTQDSVTSEEMIRKTTDAWRLSDNLGMMGAKTTVKRYAGTRYHYFDTYGVMIKSGVPYTIITATDNGEMDGNPIFLNKKQLEDKKKEQGIYIFSCQNLLKPVAKADQTFTRGMIKYYKKIPKNLNYYLAVDPANTKKKKSDYTAGIVFGFSSDRKIYIIDGFHDKLDLKERYDVIKFTNERYKLQRIGYEKYGMQSDMDYFRMENERTSYFMPMFTMKGSMSKEDRILRLVALFGQGAILFPSTINYWCKYDGRNVNIIDKLIFEMESFPFGEHDDLLDTLARMFDLFLNNPSEKPPVEVKPEDKYLVKNVFSRVIKQNKEKVDKW